MGRRVRYKRSWTSAPHARIRMAPNSLYSSVRSHPQRRSGHRISTLPSGFAMISIPQPVFVGSVRYPETYNRTIGPSLRSALATIGELERLTVFDRDLVIPPAVEAEVTTEPARTALSRFLDTHGIEPQHRVDTLLAGSQRCTSDLRPTYAPHAVFAEYDLGYVPSDVERASLRIRWYQTDDFSIHYSERNSDRPPWECRWDKHPNDHNSKAHISRRHQQRPRGECTFSW